MAAEPLRTLHSLSRRRLVLGLAAALGCALSSARAETDAPRDMSVMMDRLPYVHERAAAAVGSRPTSPHAGVIHTVDTCADDGSPNSLRSLIELSPDVHSGDTIDLAHLPMMCSKITLSNAFADGAITVSQDTLYLQGPGADQLTIDANGYSSVFRHYGYGTLQIENLTITNGYHKTSGPPQVLPRGGCIFSTGSVVLASSVVSHCETVSTGNYGARGGAIYARGDLRMFFSSIRQGVATSILFWSYGGGADVHGDLDVSYSTIRDNSATAGGEYAGMGGGVYAYGAANVMGSTISLNSADLGGGLEFAGHSYATAIVNSSVSSNTGRYGYGGVWTNEPLSLVNSTVAFNRANVRLGTAGLSSSNGGAVTLQSSIVADNFGGQGSEDIYLDGAQIDPASKDNLIISSNVPSPLDTVTVCPRLDPLADNGGPTLTHALNHASPAIDQGNNDAFLDSDQRQVARVIGARADIGAVEWSPTDHDERIFLGGFDAKCEW